MDQHIIACPVLAKELQTVLATLGLTPEVHLMNYHVHINPDSMEEELNNNMEELDTENAQISLLVGKHCNARQPISTIAKQNNARLPDKRNCIELILGTDKTQELQQNRTAIMTPGWITMMNQSISDGQWTVEDARLNLGWYDQILLLDTGTEPIDDETIINFFELTQVPIDIMPVTLEHFQQEVLALLQP